MSQLLEEFRLELYLESTPTREVFLALANRTPSLKKLSIEATASPSDVSSSLCRWIQTCPGLEKVHIPRRWQISSVVTAFGSLPNLFEFGIEWRTDPAADMELRMEIAIEEGRFRNIRRLGWSSGIEQARDLLQRTPQRLQGLTLDCLGSPSQEKVLMFLATAVVCCPELDSLSLNLTPLAGLDAALNSEILRPLLACKRLRELRIHYHCPCILSITDIEDMGAAWLDMEELVICPDPSDQDMLGTPISSLAQVATAFPKIRLLGLYFDPDKPPGSAGDLLPASQFRCLRELDVGSSSVPRSDVASVGLYLASLFAIGTRPSIKAEVSGVRSHHFNGPIDAEWEEIERLAHLTMEVKDAFLSKLSRR
ncbi:hypothetical protein M407DRAFT_18673 [Tulasnella calospora MUT 4182]|uniref:Uncharacterized protein n=1 Tax=Tulasnella calospora MUT 4182 TaxID=1051891 RepID=A0A0C3LEM7_9AGAM|nr:hypothetical protein M407DRAFT_18673 [Tulasnella calospora MUT 4182]